MEKQIKEIVKAIKNNYKEQRLSSKTTKLLLVQTFNVQDTTWLQFIEIDQIRHANALVEIVLLRHSYDDQIYEVRLQNYLPFESGATYTLFSIQTISKVCDQINGYLDLALNDFEEVK